MYAYDELDRTIVNERVVEFRDQVARRLSGELTEDEFKSLRLMNGVYLQLHAYMLRIAIPYGTLSSEQMRALAHVARKYDRGYGHFTTRQNIQFPWIKLADPPAPMAAQAGSGFPGMQHINLSTSLCTPQAVMLEQFQWVAEAVMPAFKAGRAMAAD